jgi:hypothetical protein
MGLGKVPMTPEEADDLKLLSREIVKVHQGSIPAKKLRETVYG